MDRIVTITLAGRPLPLDVAAYEALKSWLARTEAVLAADADRVEILADFEDGVAARCVTLMAGRREPIELAEMNTVLAAMGPIAGAGEGGQTDEQSEDPWRRKLYRRYDRQSWTGVSLGLARWRDLDVNLIRFFWLAATTASAGVAAGVYVLMAIMIPAAPGPEGSKPPKTSRRADQPRRAG